MIDQRSKRRHSLEECRQDQKMQQWFHRLRLCRQVQQWYSVRHRS
jgi:hypothetical protein